MRDEDFFVDAEGEEDRGRTGDNNGAGPPAAQAPPQGRGAVGSLDTASTGMADPGELRADRPSAAADALQRGPDDDEPRREAPAPPARAADEPWRLKPVAPPLPPRPIGRGDVYGDRVIAGRRHRDTPLRRLVDHVRELLISPAEREEQALDECLAALPAVSTTNVIAVLSPKGGVGKTTSTYLVGDALADLGRVGVVGLDTNPDYGTLASLVPDALRSDHSLVDLLDAFERRPTFAELCPYLSQVRGGLKLLSAPSDPYVMQRLGPADYDRALGLLAQHVEVVLLDCGTGLAGPLARWAIQRADQVVIVTTPDRRRLDRHPKSLSGSR